MLLFVAFTFTREYNALYWCSNSMCLSVCLSVCPSHAGIVWKWLKVSSKSFHCQNSDAVIPNEGLKYRREWKFGNCWPMYLGCLLHWTTKIAMTLSDLQRSKILQCIIVKYYITTLERHEVMLVKAHQLRFITHARSFIRHINGSKLNK